MKILKTGFVLAGENEKSSREWEDFLKLLADAGKKLRFFRHYKTTKQNKYEIIDEK